MTQIISTIVSRCGFVPGCPVGVPVGGMGTYSKFVFCFSIFSILTLEFPRKLNPNAIYVYTIYGWGWG
jgi:hypothetical protein